MDKFYLKDLKKAYRILRKEKNNNPVGSEKRKNFHKKMKEIKQKINDITYVEINPEKKAIIDKILEYRKDGYRESLEKFSLDELEFHYYKITGKVKNKEEYRELKGAMR